MEDFAEARKAAQEKLTDLAGATNEAQNIYQSYWNALSGEDQSEDESLELTRLAEVLEDVERSFLEHVSSVKIAERNFTEAVMEADGDEVALRKAVAAYRSMVE